MQASSVCIQQRYTVLCSLVSLSQIKGHITEIIELVQPLSFTVYEECNPVTMTMNFSSHKALWISQNGSSCTGSVSAQRVSGIRSETDRAQCAQAHHTWIPLFTASMNPEETPLFRYELTEETHKAEGGICEGLWGLVGCARTHVLHLFLLCICKRLRANV